MKYQLGNWFKSSVVKTDEHSTPTYNLRSAFYQFVYQMKKMQCACVGQYKIAIRQVLQVQYSADERTFNSDISFDMGFWWRRRSAHVSDNIEYKLDNFLKFSVVKVNKHSTQTCNLRWTFYQFVYKKKNTHCVCLLWKIFREWKEDVSA